MRQPTPGIRWGLVRHEPTREALVEVAHAQALLLAEALEADLIERARR